MFNKALNQIAESVTPFAKKRKNSATFCNWLAWRYT